MKVMNVNRSGSKGGIIGGTSRGLDTAIPQRDRQERFLAAFAACGSVLRASRWARVHRQTHYFWLREDPTYSARFDEARRRAAQELEDEAVRRAMEGIRRPVIYRGKQVFVEGQPLFETRYSDQLLIRLLEANNPERFGRRHESAEVWETDPEKLTEKQLDVLLRHFMKQFVGDDPVLLNQAMKELEAGTLVVELAPPGTPAGVVFDRPAAAPVVEVVETAPELRIEEPPAAPARKKEHWEP
jgi:hypothetical protein